MRRTTSLRVGVDVFAALACLVFAMFTAACAGAESTGALPVRLEPSAKFSLGADQRGAQRASCASYRTCGDCVPQLSCHWCRRTDSCIGIFDRSCQGETSESRSECGPCTGFHDCTSCAQAEGCGWCETNQRCLSLGEASQCDRSRWAVDGLQCASLHCVDHTTCDSCLAETPSCNWCQNSLRCVRSDRRNECGGPLTDYSTECSAIRGAGFCTVDEVNPDGSCVCPPTSVRVSSPDRASEGRCVCPSGTAWDATNAACRPTTLPSARSNVQCPAGMTFNRDPRDPRCVCPPRQRLDSNTRRCVTDTCVGDSRFDYARQECVCSAGQTLSVRRGRCMADPCPGDPTWDESTGACVCPENMRVAGATCVPECDPPCGSTEVCANGTCVGSGQLRITMTWDVPGDMDLHVITPRGSEIYYGARNLDGGRLDRDDLRGTGPENVFWDASPPTGRYRVCANPFSMSRPSQVLIVVVRGAQEIARYTVTRNGNEPRSGCAAGAANVAGEFTVR